VEDEKWMNCGQFGGKEDEEDIMNRQPPYNLLEEHWLPVLYRDGRTERIGICQAFEDAGRIRQIAATNPMDRVAILRFLLALLYWCKGNSPDKLPDGTFPSDWFKKLDDNKDCFNLLGDGKRFYQYKSTYEKKKSANYFIQEVPTGQNFWHFKHATEGIDGLCPACCAMGLLRLPVFATSGGRGKPPGVNAKPPIFVIPLGLSLAETLTISWREVSGSNLGTPGWEKPDMKLPKTGYIPLLSGLTWVPRQVWLNDPGETSSCISCGDRTPLIRQMVFAPIGSQKADEEGQGRNWLDPHVIYMSDKKGKKSSLPPGNALGSSDAASSQWAKIMAGILDGKKADGKGRLWVVGFATVQNDKYLEAMEYEIPFSCTLEDHKVQEHIETIERWQKEGKSLEDRLRKIVREIRKPRKEDARIAVSAIASVRPQVEAEVSLKLGELIEGGDDAWKLAASEYSPMMAAISKSLSPGFTSAMVQRRKQIASIKPNMWQQTTTAKKPRKKGGDK
jgi:hypothetical protein